MDLIRTISDKNFRDLQKGHLGLNFKIALLHLLPLIFTLILPLQKNQNVWQIRTKMSARAVSVLKEGKKRM